MSGDNKGSFDALLEEISGDLSKALPVDGDTAADDAKIDEAAGAAADGADPEDAGKKDGDDPEVVAKSFKITLEDGSEIEAVDGAELIKSLVGRIEKNESAVLKVLGEATKVITSQSSLIKSLRADVVALGDQGKGRRAMLSIAEKPAPKAEDLQKSSASEGMSGEEFMAKALTAQAAGRINGAQIAIAEAYINNHKAPPADIVQAVLADGK